MPDTPPEIRIARSAGVPWGKRFGPTREIVSDPPAGDEQPNKSAVADIETLLDRMGGMAVTAPPQPDTDPAGPSEIHLTRGVGQTWPARFSHNAGGGTPIADISALTSSISGGPGHTAIESSQPTQLSQLTDVQLDALNIGDVLRYAGDKWRNYNETQLTDGGNF